MKISVKEALALRAMVWRGDEVQELTKIAVDLADGQAPAPLRALLKVIAEQVEHMMLDGEAAWDWLDTIDAAEEEEREAAPAAAPEAPRKTVKRIAAKVARRARKAVSK